MSTTRLLAIPHDQLCTPEQRARMAQRSRDGRALREAVEDWASGVHADLVELDGMLAPRGLSGEEHELVSWLTGAADLVAVAGEISGALDIIAAAGPPPPPAEP
jgi:hypothetical protein